MAVLWGDGRRGHCQRKKLEENLRPIPEIIKTCVCLVCMNWILTNISDDPFDFPLLQNIMTSMPHFHVVMCH